MTGSGADDSAREAAAAAALDLVEPGMTIGLGSGRAVWRVIDGIAARWPAGPPVRAAVASSATEARAREAGIEVIALDGAVRLAVAIDGADELDAELGLIKGGGAALLREKLVVEAAERFVVVAEERKRVERLGAAARLPVEVVRFGWADTRRRLLGLVSEAELRPAPDGSALLTDEGHHLLDCPLPASGDLTELAAAIKATTGVVEHGLFIGLAHSALLGRPDGSQLSVEPQSGGPG